MTRPSRQTAHPHAAARAAGLGLLVLALLWAQLLGLAHGVRHAGGSKVGSGVAMAAPAQGALAHLLAPADDSPECRLYDQIGHGGPVAVPLLWAVAALPRLPLQGFGHGLPAVVCAPYAARAPPAAC